jgi:Xaa-Pro aminopeptidase
MNRVEGLREALRESGVDGLLILNPENRRFISGFTGSSGVLLVGATTAMIVTDFRYWEQAGMEAPGFELWKQGPNLWQAVAEAIQASGWSKIGFEADSTRFSEYQALTGALPQQQWIPLAGTVEKLRWVKDETEIALLAQAARITDQAWLRALKLIKPGVKEREIGLEFDYQLRLLGAEGSAFTTIVASGWRSALPHGAASDKEITPGDLVIIDGGALYCGYHADMTRTVVLGKADPKQRQIYSLVLEAQELALGGLKAGIIGKDADRIARDHIQKHGYGDYFGHGLGHSVGLNIHESPRLSMTESGIIPAGATVTVEPGIYLPGWGGIRIEDLVVVGATGVTNLTGSSKSELIEL